MRLYSRRARTLKSWFALDCIGEGTHACPHFHIFSLSPYQKSCITGVRINWKPTAGGSGSGFVAFGVDKFVPAC